MRYYTSSKIFPVLEIVATERAKKKAAEKFDLPFTYGNEIETYGIFKEKEFHVKVDTSELHGFEKQQYYIWMKKQYAKEFQKLVNPHKNLFNTILLSGLFLSVGATLYGCLSNDEKQQENPAPQTVQKAAATLSVQQKEKTKD